MNSCGCRTRDAGTDLPLSQGDYQVLTLGTAAETGAVTRQRVDMGRLWRELTVLEIPDAALATPLYLHLTDTDPGIRLLHRGQRIIVPPGISGSLTSQPRIYWSGDDLSGWPSDVELFAADAVQLEIEPPGPSVPAALSGTIAADGDTSFGAADPAAVSRWAVHIDVDGTFDGSINFHGRVHPTSGALVQVHYINLSTGLVATADLTADALVLVDATGLGDVIMRCAGRTAGQFDYWARPVRG